MKPDEFMRPDLDKIIEKLKKNHKNPGKFKRILQNFWGYGIPSDICRKRKRQIQKAKFMDHGSYEWSQYWRKPYGKFRRNATRYSKKAGK